MKLDIRGYRVSIPALTRMQLNRFAAIGIRATIRRQLATIKQHHPDISDNDAIQIAVDKVIKRATLERKKVKKDSFITFK